MQVAQGLLVGTHQEDAQIVFLAVLQGMQVQGGLEALRVDEVVDAAVRVTGDVRDDALA